MADALILPSELHFPARVTMLFTGALAKIKDKFGSAGLMERVEESVFGQFFKAPETKYSGVIIHELLMRRVKSNTPTELHFYIGGKKLRFSANEFGLVTGLSFADYPPKDELKEKQSNKRLLSQYLNNAQRVYLSDLESAFWQCTDVEDTWKLGLCYFVSTIIMAHEPKTQLDQGILGLAESVEDFLKFPWGRESFKQTISGYRKDLLKLRKNYIGKVEEKKKQPEAKYTVYGYAMALQYWAYEALPNVGLLYAEKVGPLFPRMLSWQSDKVPTAKELSNLFKRKNITAYPILNPRPDEKEYHSTIMSSVNDPSVERDDVLDFDDRDIDEDTLREAQEAAATAERENIFPESPKPKTAAPDIGQEEGHSQRLKIELLAAEVESLKKGQQEIKQELKEIKQEMNNGQEEIKEQLKKIMSILEENKQRGPELSKKRPRILQLEWGGEVPAEGHEHVETPTV